MLLEFAIGNNLTVMSTQFQNKNIHKGTWLAPDQLTLNQIDHVLINNKKKDLTEDVRSMRGPNIDSDHYLLMIIVSQNLPKIYTKKNIVQSVTWNKSNLKNPTKLLEYRKALYTKLENQYQLQDMEQEWDQIKKAITEAAQETIQTQNKKQKNEWWDDCQQAIKEKNEARKTWLQHRTRASNARYHKKRNEANRICTRKKKEWLNNRIRQIEENKKKNEPKKFFNKIKQLTWQNTRLPDMCKDDQNVVLTQMGQILNRWK